MRVFERVGHMSVEWHDPGPKVPDEDPPARAQHAADLGQAGRRIAPVVHRQCAHDQVERSVREGKRRHVADEERWPLFVAVPRTIGIGPGGGRGPNPPWRSGAPPGPPAATSAAMRMKNEPNRSRWLSAS